MARKFAISIFIGLLGGLLGISILSAREVSSNSFGPRIAGKACRIWDDPQGIAHVDAPDELSTFACMGYLHGRDRGWEMDFLRRISQGRVSEVIDSKYVETDFLMRLLGLEDRSRKLFSELPKTEQDLLWAYSFGVNQGVEQSIQDGSAYEFSSFNYRPEPWEPSDSLGLLLLQSFDQTRRAFEVHLEENQWQTVHGKDADKLFDYTGSPWDTTILKPGEYPSSHLKAWTNVPSSLPIRGLEQFFSADLPDLFSGVGRGSNNWVLSSSRSTTGHAWLANDPHLKLTTPAFWYWAHVHGPGLDAIGASLPGLPFIVSGANLHTSWGLTNAFTDVARVSYVPASDLENGKTYWPVIWIKLWGPIKVPFFFKKFQRTSQNWPVIPLDGPRGKKLVLRWTGFDLTASDVAGLFDLMKSRSVRDIDRSFSSVGVPSWNFVFADDQGGIGYRATGRVPKEKGSYLFGVPVESLKDLKEGQSFPELLSADEMPHLLQPRRGYIVTANNRQWQNDSVYQNGRTQLNSFRAFRIEELLGEKPKHDLKSLEKIQCDIQAVDARFLAPKMVAVFMASHDLSQRNEWISKALEVLGTWDFEASLECRACGIYRRWVDQLMSDRKLNANALYRKLETAEADFRLKKSSADLDFVTAVGVSLDKAVSDLKPRSEKLGPDWPPKWGEIHTNAFDHLSGKRYFPTRALPTGGDEQSVNPGTSNFKDGLFHQTSGASQRLIVEMTSPPTIYDVLAGENQDVEHRDLFQPGSEWQKWANCEFSKRYFPVDWDRIATKRVILKSGS